MARYVVKCEKRDTDTLETMYLYFTYAHYNPYNKIRELTEYKNLVGYQQGAFIFRERAAAEVIAATWGGRVVKLKPKVK